MSWLKLGRRGLATMCNVRDSNCNRIIGSQILVSGKEFPPGYKIMHVKIMHTHGMTQFAEPPPVKFDSNTSGLGNGKQEMTIIPVMHYSRGMIKVQCEKPGYLNRVHGNWFVRVYQWDEQGNVWQIGKDNYEHDGSIDGSLEW